MEKNYKIEVAILGPKGTFSESAAKRFFNNIDNNIKILYFDAIDDIFEYVSKNNIYGIVPLENSIEGTVNLTVDCLLEYDVKIYGEIVLDINLMLCSKSNDLKNIKAVYSHPQALAQCRKFLKKFKLKTFSCESTAKACEIAKNDPSISAIASKEAANLYNLNILFENIQDYKSQTRFIVISKEKAENFRSNKTSIIFSTEDKPGALYHVLGEFAKRNINLKKIESRPSKKMLGEYFFFLDVEGNLRDDNLKDAVECVKEHAKFLKILGSY